MEDIEIFSAQCPNCGKEAYFFNSHIRITICSACGENFSAGIKKSPKELENINAKCYCKNKLVPCPDDLKCSLCQQKYRYVQYAEKKIEGGRLAKIPSISDDELKLRLIEYLTDGDYTKEDFAENINFENTVKVMIPVDLYKSRFKASWAERINKNYIEKAIEGEITVGITITSKIQRELILLISSEDPSEKETEIRNLQNENIQLLPIDINPEDEYKNNYNELAAIAVKKYLTEEKSNETCSDKRAEKQTAEQNKRFRRSFLKSVNTVLKKDLSEADAGKKFLNFQIKTQDTRHEKRLYYPFLIAPIVYGNQNKIYQTAVSAVSAGKCGGLRPEYTDFKNKIKANMKINGLILILTAIFSCYFPVLIVDAFPNISMDLLRNIYAVLLFIILPLLIINLGALWYRRYRFVSDLKKKRLKNREDILKRENLLYLKDVKEYGGKNYN